MAWPDHKAQRGLLLMAATATLWGCAALARAHGLDENEALLKAQARSSAAGPFFWMGLRHMLGGVDHLLFVLALLLGQRRWQPTLWLVTAFSLGHSATLYLGFVAPWQADPLLIDAAVATSVALAAATFVQNTPMRAAYLRLACGGLGLLHGLGLAASLQGIAPEQANLAWKLVAFNLGVEAAQGLALAAMVGLGLLWQRLPRQEALHSGALRNGALRALVVWGLVMTGVLLARHAAPPPAAATLSQTPYRSEHIDIALAAAGEPGDELEWTLDLQAGETLVYDWQVDAPDAEFYSDFHGLARTNGRVLSHHQGLGHAAAGRLTAPFTGVHGWYLQNQSVRPVVLRLRLAGFYTLRPDPYAPAE